MDLKRACASFVRLWILLAFVVYCRESRGQTKSPTKAPTGTGVPSVATKAPTLQGFQFSDPTLGTAFAPTTPGGACLNSQDLGTWRTSNIKGKNGFDLFPADLQLCSERCGFLAVSLPQSAEYDCGGFAEPACAPDIFAICVRDCMAREEVLTEAPGFPTLATKDPYTLPCAACMGNVSACAVENCFSSCPFRGRNDVACQECNSQFCNDAFEICAGLNIDQRPVTAQDLSGVVLGSVGGGVLLVLVAIAFGYRYRVKTRQLKHMNPQEMEQMAKMQQYSGDNSRFGGTGGFSGPGRSFLPYGNNNTNSNNNTIRGGFTSRTIPIAAKNVASNMVGYRNSLGSAAQNFAKRMTSKSSYESEDDIGSMAGPMPHRGGAGGGNNNSSMMAGVPVQMTQYQMQYETQRKAHLSEAPHPKPTPSARMSLLASGPVPAHLLTGGGVALVMLWDFTGDRSDELTVKAGDKVLGFQEEDGWYLAMTRAGKYGLVPANYTAHDLQYTNMQSRKTNPSRNIPPSARMSKMHASMIATPSVKVLQMPATPLIAIYDFNALRPDEITVKTGTIVMGIHEQDGWWLIRTESGNKMGLIPSNFLEKVMMSAQPTSTEEQRDMSSNEMTLPRDLTSIQRTLPSGILQNGMTSIMRPKDYDPDF